MVCWAQAGGPFAGRSSKSIAVAGGRKVGMRTSIKQAICSKGFLWSVLGFAMMMFASSASQLVEAFRMKLLEYGFHGSFVLQALSSQGMTMVLPILCTLLYTASFFEDLKTGFIKAYLPRTTISKYISGKLAGCILSGGGSIALGILLSYGLSFLVFYPMELAPIEGWETPQYFAQLLQILPLYFASGSLWAVFGMIMAALTRNQYMAYASPFILYYLLIILYERYFEFLYILYPKQWLMPGEGWPFGNLGALFWVMELLLLLCICFTILARRRLKNV